MSASRSSKSWWRYRRSPASEEASVTNDTPTCWLRMASMRLRHSSNRTSPQYRWMPLGVVACS